MAGARRRIRRAGRVAARVTGAMIIAIDGPAASGKGTLAERLARALRPALSRHRPALPRRRRGAWPSAGARPRRRRQPPGASPAALDPAALDDPASARPRGRRARLAGRRPCRPVRAALARVPARLRRAGRAGAVLDGRDIGTVDLPRCRREDLRHRHARRSARGGAPTNCTPRAATSTTSASSPRSRERDARDAGRAGRAARSRPPTRTCSIPATWI